MNGNRIYSISFMQYTLLIHGIQVATSVLSLPRQLAEIASTDGWIALVLSWLVNLVFSIIMVAVMRQYPEDNFFKLLERLFGKAISKFIIGLVALHFAFSAWSTFISTMLYTRAWFLTMTPIPFILLLVVIPAYITARKHILAIARYCEIVFFLTIWMVPVLLIPLREGYLIHLLPVIKDGWGPILQAMPTTTKAYLGFEILFIIYPYLRRKDLAVHGIVLGNTLTMLIYVFSTLVCFIFFSPDEIFDYNQPVLNLLKLIEFRFLERFDIIFLAMYLFVISTSLIPFIYGASVSGASLFGTKSHGPYVLVICISTILFASWLKPSWFESLRWNQWASYSGLIVSYLLPVLLYLSIKIYQKITPKEASR
ncbi:spore gernimation protein [Brevibacillus laterosporus]|uniref:GerAB/ArcD/ProY family transporter n=1 Tax=Brevibacillus laterosporus TaxID=1465 RepID=UPI000CE450F9|nr:endospore germination permease [Brevibacillus laterosporus]PPA82063.1 spore gernimation protein [Brevibacillus laterosporus]